ncbi:hypothetical protein GGX14DRAFT_596076 [Mycena pura]|uniref:Uncharacterized protein n=1 Tax=Mycena pura TaxID=153505 RepID=A0AAD6UQB4_9AGAR|nr:hypothetical protein GGX14DRAFT_596076 [Mycena pura]
MCRRWLWGDCGHVMSNIQLKINSKGEARNRSSDMGNILCKQNLGQLYFSDSAWVDLDDLQAWLRHRGHLDHLLDPTISERNFPPVGLDPRSAYGTDGTFGNVTFDFYPPVNFDQPRSAAPYSFKSNDNYQSSNHSGPSSGFEYLSASGLPTPSSGLSTLSSGLKFFDDNASEPNLDWDPSLAAFFDSMETPALVSSPNLLFLPPDNLSALVSDPTGMNDALASGSDASFSPLNVAPSHALAPEPTDMEAAPWIGMARSFIKRMDVDKRPSVDVFLPKVLRTCRRDALEFMFPTNSRSLDDSARRGLRHSVKPHVDEIQWTRFQAFLALTTRI